MTNTSAPHLYDFDPQLPALARAFDREAVIRLFAEDWPTALAERSHISISSCRLQDTKYQPGRRCVTTYELEIAHPEAIQGRTLGVVEITPRGIDHRLFDSDPNLPWLAAALDVEGMRERFSMTLQDHPPIHSCSVTPIRYKPGARCVFRYDLQTSAGVETYFGKLLQRDGDVLMATICGLHRLSERMPTMPRIPQPLAYWADVHMLMQPAVAGGAELNTRAFAVDEEPQVRVQLLREAGRNLAGLHLCPGVDGPRRTFAEDIAELGEYIAPMQQAAPALTERFRSGINRLEGLASGQPESTPVPSHGAFRTDQFMIEGSALVMIDLDGFCWANPARDVGNFCAYLHWKALRQPQQAGFIRHAGEVFLESYRTFQPTLNELWLTLYTAASMLKIAGRRFRSLTVKEWPLVAGLIDGALALLSGHVEQRPAAGAAEL